MKRLFIMFIYIFIFVMPQKIYPELMLGLGWQSVTLDNNNSVETLIAPDGEKIDGPYIYIGVPKRRGFSPGFSFGGYILEKYITDYSERIDVKWETSSYNVFIEYSTPFGNELTNPYLGIRAGISIVPVKASAIYSKYTSNGWFSSWETIDSDSNSDLELGPYLGASFQIPVLTSPVTIFLIVEKTFVDYKDDINVGYFSFGGGLAYTFKKKK